MTVYRTAVEQMEAVDYRCDTLCCHYHTSDCRYSTTDQILHWHYRSDAQNRGSLRYVGTFVKSSLLDLTVDLRTMACLIENLVMIVMIAVMLAMMRVVMVMLCCSSGFHD